MTGRVGRTAADAARGRGHGLRDRLGNRGQRHGPTRPASCYGGRPRKPSTVEFLATHVGLSPATLAALRPEGRRAPLTCLSHWRLSLAADLLVITDQTLATIAAKVGHANAFAISAAFKRVRGASPRNYRNRHAA
ncbi:MAG: helix-turn-helix domain-containing protein [Nocardioidaceae bacterium]